ncbi:hypothetical protein [Legionella impletisoli]|uniref:F-box domain-containing protein n=1 Tax=Legionella impletisoli TaxID=343510 RepID=A0A917JWV0_9GAMM|nr:hypothetical protein [Legionella impletisoli]GGI87946.1 hypothetical protein GCM10007966_15860 [Legionella impletisoli]
MPSQEKEKANKDAGGESLSLLEQLPTELHHKVLAQYPEKDWYNLSQVSSTMFFACQYPLERKAAQTLLSHVIRGEEAEALKMIVANPRLLLIPSQATDYSGHSYIGITPFQAALIWHDVMLWKKIEPYFDELPNGQAEKVSQFKALFPEGLPKQEPYDFRSLIQVISRSSNADIMAALQKKNNNTPICQALKNFRTNFTDLTLKEQFFNPLHLIEALNVYNTQFDHWSWHQRDLFWRQAIGYIQRFTPASYAQAFCQGLYYIIEEKNPRRRSLTFQDDDATYFTPGDSVGLGFDFAASWLWGNVRSGGPGFLREALAGALLNYVEQIQQSYLDLSTTCEEMDNPSRTATI